MLKSVFRSLSAMTFLMAASLPATAQVDMRVDVRVPDVEIRVGHRAPPRPRSEWRPHRPGREYVWVPGAWDWQGDAWVWIGGRWERPYGRSVRWVSPRYVREGPAWRYEPGHWSNQRVVEGDEYRRFRVEGRRDRHRDRDDDRYRDRDRDRDGDHDHR